MDPSTHWQYHPVRACFFHTTPTTGGNGHHPVSWGCGISADKSVRVKTDSEWLTDTTQSEDTGGRRESVSRSNWWGERDVAERKIDVDGSMDKGCGLRWALLLKDSS